MRWERAGKTFNYEELVRLAEAARPWLAWSIPIMPRPFSCSPSVAAGLGRLFASRTTNPRWTSQAPWSAVPWKAWP